MKTETEKIVKLIAAVVKLMISTGHFAFNLALLYYAIKHRHDLMGVVLALIYIAEQIHMEVKL